LRINQTYVLWNGMRFLGRFL